MANKKTWTRCGRVRATPQNREPNSRTHRHHEVSTLHSQRAFPAKVNTSIRKTVPSPASFWCLLFMTPRKDNIRRLNHLRDSHRTNGCSFNTFVCFALVACIEYLRQAAGLSTPARKPIWRPVRDC